MQVQLNPSLTYGKANRLQDVSKQPPFNPEARFSGGLNGNAVTQHGVYAAQNMTKFAGGMGPAVMFNPKALQPQTVVNRAQGYAQQLLGQGRNQQANPFYTPYVLPVNNTARQQPLLYVLV